MLYPKRFFGLRVAIIDSNLFRRVAVAAVVHQFAVLHGIRIEGLAGLEGFLDCSHDLHQMVAVGNGAGNFSQDAVG